MIWICDKPWQVIYVPKHDRQLMRSDGTFTIGVCDNNAKTIFISNNLSRKMHDKCLLHELCHAFIFETGICFDVDTEELVCDFIASNGRNIIETADMILSFIDRMVA